MSGRHRSGVPELYVFSQIRRLPPIHFGRTDGIERTLLREALPVCISVSLFLYLSL